MRIGIDIVEVERFETIDAKKFFTENELKYIESKGVHKFETMAGLYSAKEAVIKAFKTKIGNGNILKQLEILHDENGAPFLVENDLWKNLANEIGLTKVEISISHTKNFAEAICLIYN